MNMLMFRVIGSAKEPYELTALGAGAELRITCDCRAGRNKAFCKHVSYLLHGDVGKLVSPSMADVEELSRRAVGSPLLIKAGHRIDKDMSQAEAEGLHSIADVYERFKAEFEALGWTVKFVERDGELDKDRLELYAQFKNGTLRKRPSVTLEHVRLGYEEGAYEFDWSSDPSEVSAGTPNLIPRQKPYGLVKADGGTIAGPWKLLSAAVPKFLETSRRGPQAKF